MVKKITTIRVSTPVWRELQTLKLAMQKRSIEDVIMFLIEFFYKYRSVVEKEIIAKTKK